MSFEWNDWSAWLANDWVQLSGLFAILLIVLWVKMVIAKRVVAKTPANFRSPLWFIQPLMTWPSTLALSLIWLSISLPITEWVLEYTQPSWISSFFSLAWLGLFVFAGLKVIQSWRRTYVRQKLHSGVEYDKTTLDVLVKVLKLSLWVIALLSVMPVFGLNISALLAAGGVAGLVVGMAAKDLLANFFGAFMIYLDRPFKIGDWVRIPSEGIEGTVEEIGWRITLIRTFEKRPLYVPNAVFSSQVIENPSRMTHRRISEVIGIRYQDVELLKPLCERLEASMKQNALVDQNETIIVAFDKFNDSSIDVLISCFVKTTSRSVLLEAKEDILLDAYAFLRELGGDIAFPTRTLDIPAGLLTKS